MPKWPDAINDQSNHAHNIMHVNNNKKTLYMHLNAHEVLGIT